jgi:predicted CXXCH cytochrome family protein
MKKVLAAAMLVVFAASAAFAAAPPEKVSMKAKNGDVTFNHKKHSAAGDCKVCHGEGAPAKLTLDKDAAHKLCRGCHDTKKAGPTKCGECHKK